MHPSLHHPLQHTPNQRQTKQRQLIEAILEQAEGPLLPKELLNKAQASLPQLGIATVFRTLKKLVETGGAKVVHLPGDSPRYERATRGHHHHFKCCECEAVFEIKDKVKSEIKMEEKDCPGHLDQLLPEGFQLTGHELTLFGRCANCAADHTPIS